MTIGKGETWGGPSPSIGELPVADDDRALAALAFDHWQRDRQLVATVLTGDLLSTVGLDRPRRPEQRWRFSVDLGLARFGGDSGRPDPVPFVAHLVARRFLWRGRGAVVMNTPLLGSRRLGPRAHPNDGLLDITTGSLDWRQRLEAARRARTGSHLPHPDLRMIRVERWKERFESAIPVYVDGHRLGSFRTVAVELVPDAFELVV